MDADATDRDRMLILGMLDTLLRAAHRLYYADLPLAEGVEMTLITNTIWLADHNGGALTKQKLAENTGIKRTTLYRRLDYLKSKGFIVERVERRGRGKDVYLAINPTILTRPTRLANVGRARNVITKTAKMLSRLPRRRRRH